MKKIKTGDATIAQIAWLTALIRGARPNIDLFIALGNAPHQTVRAKNMSTDTSHHWSPATNPTQGWPFIEEKIYTFSSDDSSGGPPHEGVQTKYAWHRDGVARAHGDSFLIAGLRAVAVAHFGEETEIPDEL